MIPVTQTKVVVKNSKGEQVVHGNCFAAAIASMMELPITDVPNVEVFFCSDNNHWQEIMDLFLQLKGWELFTNNDFKVFHDGRYGVAECNRGEMMRYCEDKYYLVSGQSPRGVKHICIYQNGKLVHDPHPSKDGLLTEEIFQELIKIKS